MKIDKNEQITCLKLSELLVLPEQFKNFPRQAVDIRIAGLVPLDLSTTWDNDAKADVQQWLKLGKNCQVQAKIELVLLKYVILVESVQIVNKLKSIELDVVPTDFKKIIIERNLGVANAKQLEILRNMVVKAGKSHGFNFEFLFFLVHLDSISETFPSIFFFVFFFF